MLFGCAVEVNTFAAFVKSCLSTRGFTFLVPIFLLRPEVTEISLTQHWIQLISVDKQIADIKEKLQILLESSLGHVSMFGLAEALVATINSLFSLHFLYSTNPQKEHTTRSSATTRKKECCKTLHSL